MPDLGTALRKELIRQATVTQRMARLAESWALAADVIDTEADQAPVVRDDWHWRRLQTLHGIARGLRLAAAALSDELEES